MNAEENADFDSGHPVLDDARETDEGTEWEYGFYKPWPDWFNRAVVDSQDGGRIFIDQGGKPYRMAHRDLVIRAHDGSIRVLRPRA